MLIQRFHILLASITPLIHSLIALYYKENFSLSYNFIISITQLLSITKPKSIVNSGYLRMDQYGDIIILGPSPNYPFVCNTL